MDWYLMTKFAHVSIAVLWLGGGVGLMILGFLADRAKNRDDLLAAVRMASILGPRVFMPGSILVLLTGLAMVWFGGLAWDAWVVIGLVGIALTAGIGSLKLGPLSARIAAMTAEGRIDEAAEMGRALLRHAKIDYVLQFAIVFAMVTKPDWSQMGTLSAMAVVVGLTILAILMSPTPKDRSVTIA